MFNKEFFSLKDFPKKVVLTMVFLLPLFFLPWTADKYDFNKLILLWLAIAVIFCYELFLIFRGSRSLILKMTILDIPVLAFLVAALISSIFGQDWRLSFFGFYGKSYLSLLSFLSLSIFFFTVVRYFKLDDIKTAIKAILASYSVAALFYVPALWLPYDWAQGANLTGYRLAGLIVFSVLMLFLGLSQFFFGKKGESSGKRSLYLIPVIISVVLCGLVFIGSNWKAGGIKLITEIPRLSVSTSWQIAKEAIKEYPVLGSGIGTFAYDFSQYRGADLNMTKNWQNRSTEGGSFILEMFTTGGILTGLAFTALGLFALMVIGLVFRKAGKGESRSLSYGYGLSFAIGTQLLLMFFYPMNFNLLFIYFLLMALAMVWVRENIEKMPEAYQVKYFKEISYSLKGNARDKIVLSVWFLFVFLWLGIFALLIKNWAADAYFKNYNGDRYRLEKAADLNPYEFHYQVALAKYHAKAAIELGGQGTVNKEDLKKEMNQSLDWGRNAAKLAPRSVIVWENLATTYRDFTRLTSGSEKLAYQIFSKAFSLEPTNPVLATELGKAYVSAGDYSEAKRFFAKAIELKEDYADAKLNLGKAYIEEKSYKQAQELLMPLADTGASYEACYELGRMSFNQGKKDEAIAYFNRALKLNPKHSNSLYSLGLSWEEKGDKEKALVYFKKALDLNPSNLLLQEKIRELSK